MGVYPDPAKLFRVEAGIDLVVKVIRHCLIVEGDMDQRAGLFHQLQVLDQEQIRRGSDSKTADFRIPIITQKQ